MGKSFNDNGEGRGEERGLEETGTCDRVEVIFFQVGQLRENNEDEIKLSSCVKRDKLKC